MSASYPKPDGSKVNRHAPVFGWVTLPAEGRQGDPPELPRWRIWHPETVVWWESLWRKPQATLWDQDGSSLHKLATLMDDLINGRADAARVGPEARQIEDRHGLSPKAMLQLRWRLAPDEPERPPRPKLTARERRLRALK